MKASTNIIIKIATLVATLSFAYFQWWPLVAIFGYFVVMDVLNFYKDWKQNKKNDGGI